MSQTAARWQLLVQRQLWAARKETCNAVWTDWMRSRDPEKRLAVLRKLRGLLWLAWTRPQFEPPPRHLHSQRVPRASRRACRCSECARCVTNTCLRASELSPSTRRWHHCAGATPLRLSGPGWVTDGSSTSTISGAGKRLTRWCGTPWRLISPLPPRPATARKSHAAERSREVLALLCLEAGPAETASDLHACNR